MPKRPQKSDAMRSRLRHLPGLRTRSNVEIGVYSAILANLVISAALAVTSPEFFRDPPAALLAALAGVGGAVFIAYTVGMSNLFHDLPRGSETETFVGFLVGLCICGVAGVVLALVLLEVAKPLGWLAHLAFFWAGISMILLAVLVASLPLFTYEAARSRHINRDE
jgi:peptidoglycan biosynthesis protein MviN/MurJ (putative lipid II flippase)